jgi:hypothetical protein
LGAADLNTKVRKILNGGKFGTNIIDLGSLKLKVK